jgi:hypothetical protein
MTLPENALRYDACSLQELRQFVTDRKITFKYTYAQSHTKKSRTKREKNERRKLVVALQRTDAIATFRLLDLPPELRDEVYHHFFMNQEVRYYYHFSKNGMVADNLQRVPEQIREEMSAVFNAVLQLRGLREKMFEDVPSSEDIRNRSNLALFLGTGFSSLVWSVRMPEPLQVYGPNLNPCLMNRPTDRVVDIWPQFRSLIFRMPSSSTADLTPKFRRIRPDAIDLKHYGSLSKTHREVRTCPGEPEVQLNRIFAENCKDTLEVEMIPCF